VVDDAGAVYLAQLKGGAGLDVDVGVDLPALAQLAGGLGGGAFFERGHAALALFAGEVLRADGAGLRVLDFIEPLHAAGRLRVCGREQDKAKGQSKFEEVHADLLVERVPLTSAARPGS
jgi:hypothetical protein